MEQRVIANYHCEVGENPLWHPAEQCLYWCDIPAGRLFRYRACDGVSEQLYQGSPIGGFTFQANGAVLLFMAGGAIREWRVGALRTIVEGLPGEAASRFNDVIADPRGRVFCGTMPAGDRPGRLYRLDTDGTIRTVLEGIRCSNGLAFSLDRTQLYYTDSLEGTIWVFDYDEDTGDIGNRRLFARVPEDEGLPDGLTVDRDGFVWSARWNGSAVVRYRPDGAIERTIELPVRYVSSVAFGGDDFGELFMTSARGTRNIDEHPWAGALFSVRTKIRGVAEFFSGVCQ